MPLNAISATCTSYSDIFPEKNGTEMENKMTSGHYLRRKLFFDDIIDGQ
jgi:hypothetical protein